MTTAPPESTDKNGSTPAASSKASRLKIMIGYVVGSIFYVVCFVVAIRLSPEWWLNIWHVYLEESLDGA